MPIMRYLQAPFISVISCIPRQLSICSAPGLRSLIRRDFFGFLCSMSWIFGWKNKPFQWPELVALGRLSRKMIRKIHAQVLQFDNVNFHMSLRLPHPTRAVADSGSSRPDLVYQRKGLRRCSLFSQVVWSRIIILEQSPLSLRQLRSITMEPERLAVCFGDDSSKLKSLTVVLHLRVVPFI